ncbi:MAG: PAS domain S-box protein [Verrucomicrobiota bacterium]
MSEELRILIIEDVAADVVMINHELRKAGLNFRSKRVDTKAAFLHELEHERPDVILSDHGLPSFDGFTALAMAQDLCPDIPFIFVTGSLGEEVAIETLKSGATDYVLKNRLGLHLVPAIRRAVREADDRRKHKDIEHALHESEERFRLLVEGVKDYALCMLDPEGRIMNWNAGAEWIMGYSASEIIGRHFSCFYPTDDVAQSKPDRALQLTRAEGRHEEECWLQRKSGSRFIANVIINALRDATGRLRGFAHVARDITALKQAQEALQKSWLRYRQLVELFPDAVMVLRRGELVFVNEAAARLLGAASPDEIIGGRAKNLIHADDWEHFRVHLRDLREGQAALLKRTRAAREQSSPATFTEMRLLRVDGKPVEVVVVVAPLSFEGHRAEIIFAYKRNDPASD